MMKTNHNWVIILVATFFPIMSDYVFADLGTPYGETGPYKNNYAFGLDISSVKQRQDRGTEYKEDGVIKPALQIFRDHGYNWGSIRVCNEPARLPQNREYVITLAQEAKKTGLKFLLVFMYSNSWADPTNQPTPRE